MIFSKQEASRNADVCHLVHRLNMILKNFKVQTIWRAHFSRIYSICKSNEHVKSLDIHSFSSRSLHFSTFSSSLSRIVAFFQEDSMIPFIRSESHTLIDLLASSGGLFGLFMGASLLSFIELIYYLIVRSSIFACSTNDSN